MPRHASEYFTPAGRVLVFLTLIGSAGGVCAYVAWGAEELPAGRYPLVFFAMPVLIAAFIFFAIGSAVLKWFGFAIFKDPDLHSEYEQMARDEAREAEASDWVEGAAGDVADDTR